MRSLANNCKALGSKAHRLRILCLKKSDLTGADLSEVALDTAILDQVNLQYAYLAKTQVPEISNNGKLFKVSGQPGKAWAAGDAPLQDTATQDASRQTIEVQETAQKILDALKQVPDEKASEQLQQFTHEIPLFLDEDLTALLKWIKTKAI